MSHDARSPPSTGCSRSAGLDAVLATKDASIAYLTGFWGLQLERFFGVAVKRGGDGRADRADARPRERRRRADRPGQDALRRARSPTGCPTLFATLDGAKRIGVEEDHLNFARARALAEAGYELVPATDLVMQLRAAKDAEEVEAVRRACAHIEAPTTSCGRPAGRRHRGRGQRARGLHASPAAAATHPEPHILFGAHAAEAHGSPGERTLQAGDVVVADIAAQFDGYWGDLTRCAHAGPPSDWAAHGLGGRARGLRRRGRGDARRQHLPRRGRAPSATIIEAHPEIGACLHGAGHAIGTEIHEPPFLIAELGRAAARGHDLHRRARDLPLRAGGIRLEDDILVGPDGPVMLLSHPAGATGSLAPARLRAYIRRIFSRLPQVCHRAPAAAAAGVEEDPAAVAARAAVQAGDAGRVGEQGDGVGGDGEAHAARLVVAPVEAEAAVLAADERARGDGLRVGEAQPRERELVRLLARARARRRSGAARCAGRARARAPPAPPGRPATPSRAPQRSSESGSSSASVAATSRSSSVQSTRVGEVQRRASRPGA